MAGLTRIGATGSRLTMYGSAGAFSGTASATTPYADTIDAVLAKGLGFSYSTYTTNTWVTWSTLGSPRVGASKFPLSRSRTILWRPLSFLQIWPLRSVRNGEISIPRAEFRARCVDLPPFFGTKLSMISPKERRSGYISKSNHRRAQMIGALEQLEAG
jgi:hypothetical protein